MLAHSLRRSSSTAWAMARMAGAMSWLEKSRISRVISLLVTSKDTSRCRSIFTATLPSEASCRTMAPAKFLAVNLAGLRMVTVSPTWTNSSE